MMLLWAVAGVPLGVYNIVEEFNIALRIQPQILTTLSLLTWAQCLYYGKVNISVSIQQDPCNTHANSEIPNHEVLCRRHFASAAVGRHWSWTHICLAGRKKPWTGMASYRDGSFKCVFTCSRCTETLLGYLCPPDCSRNQLHICGNWCCWWLVFTRLCL